MPPQNATRWPYPKKAQAMETIPPRSPYDKVYQCQSQYTYLSIYNNEWQQVRANRAIGDIFQQIVNLKTYKSDALSSMTSYEYFLK